MNPSTAFSGAMPSRQALSTAAQTARGSSSPALRYRREHRMKEPVLALPHRVLVVAEGGQSMLDEMRERSLRIMGGNSVVEPLERPEVIGEAGGDQVEHRAP